MGEERGGEDRRREWKGGELKEGEGKEREGNNVLPHLKRAVAAYVHRRTACLRPNHLISQLGSGYTNKYWPQAYMDCN